MAQHDQNIANADGATVRADINNALAAVFTNSSGTSAPSTTVAHQLWADTTSNLLKKRNAANSGWVSVRTLDEAFVLARSSNTILGVSDVGKAINASSTFTQTLTAAATLGDGWFIDYANTGTGVITLDPNSSETIDGLTTIQLGPKESCRIYCNGSAFTTTGLSRGVKHGSFTRDLSIASGTQAVTGVGFKPRLVELIANLGGNAATSLGKDDGASPQCFYNNHHISANTWDNNTTVSVNLILSGASYAGVISSMDADGFTMSWTKGASPTGTARIGYVAHR